MSSSFRGLRQGHHFVRSVLFGFALIVAGCDEGAPNPHDVCNEADVAFLPMGHELPACTGANEGAFECTRGGAGVECRGGCWSSFYDGPCSVFDASTSDSGN